ncbi:hypothetical protein DCC62_22885 [candidate division KSB1 bacterium]|nr:MAG: hypothetical protein DCC62_22885 [candidate division KSB1 bacterium]
MIFGDELVITKEGIHISDKSLKAIGIFPDTKIYMQPLRTFEYRETEPGHYYSNDLLVTPIHPSMWPFVIRFVLRLRNRPGTIQRAFEFFRKYNINILFAECTRSGHHHITLNVLGEHQHLQAITVKQLFQKLNNWQSKAIKHRPNAGEYLSWLSGIIEEFIRIQDASLDGAKEPDGIPKWNGHNEKLEWKNKDIGLLNKVAEYISFKHYAGLSLEGFLEAEIREAQPQVAKIEHESGENHRSPHETYQYVEYQTLPVRVVLDAILIYKNIICDYLKLRLIQDSLTRPVPNQEPLQLFSFYLYNVQYYGGLMDNTTFGFNILRLSNSHDYFDSIISDIRNKLQNVKNELKRPSDFGTRIDLDPVLISSLEFLSHAYYHRIYARYFVSKAQESFIPFPDLKEHPTDFLNAILPDRKTATLAIASSNTDDYTLRLCPIPIRALNRFRSIKIAEYARECPDQCSKEWFSETKKNDILDLKVEPEEPGSENCIRPSIEVPEKDTISGYKSRKDPSCPGSSVGLLECILKSLEKVNKSNEGPQYLLSQWRMYNQLFKITRNHESGAIHLLVEATGPNFFGFSNDCWDQELKERFDVELGQDYSRRHIKIGKVCATEISGGRVFVSLSFGHPMKNKWMECVTRIGKDLGFHNISTVETFTRPVTDEVALGIKNSHAMFQILALPLAKESEVVTSRREDKHSKLMWLHAEYLTARTNGLKIVRLVDENSIDTNTIPIGRDHASFIFSVSKPFDDFEKIVHEAFLHLRRDLADNLGLR